MPTTSRAVEIKKRMIEILDAALTVDVHYGPPGEGQSNSLVWFGNVSAESNLATIKTGRRTRNEELLVDCWIEVSGDPGDSEGAETESVEIMAAVEDALANDPGLRGATGVDLVDWSRIASWEMRSGAESQGWAVEIEMKIYVHSRLT